MLQNISDKKLCEILGMELSDYDMIDRKMEDACAAIRKKDMRRLFTGLGRAGYVWNNC